MGVHYIKKPFRDEWTFKWVMSIVYVWEKSFRNYIMLCWNISRLIEKRGVPNLFWFALLGGYGIAHQIVYLVRKNIFFIIAEKITFTICIFRIIYLNSNHSDKQSMQIRCKWYVNRFNHFPCISNTALLLVSASSYTSQCLPNAAFDINTEYVHR